MRSIDYFDKVANRHPERMALIAGETRYTYGELQALSHKAAGAMLGAGLKHQEPAAILSPNDGAVLVSLLGLWRAGAVWIPVNTRNALDANIAYLNYVRPVWFFYHSSLAAEADEVRAAVPSIRHVICLDREGGDHPSLTTFMATFGEREITDWGDASGNPDELVAIIATGGTTGPAKGVRILNRSWSQMLETIVNEMQVAGVPSLAARSNDAYLTSKVKARFVDAGKFNPFHVKVVTEAGVVYLMGIVTQQEAADAGQIARTTGGAQAWCSPARRYRTRPWSGSARSASSA